MPDSTDPDPQRDPSAANSDRDWYVQQWNALCEELGTADPNEVLARVQTLKRQMEQLDDQDRDADGLVTISEVEEVFREMNAKIEKLRERNASLVEQLEGDRDSDAPLRELRQHTERLLDALGAPTLDDAHDRIEHLNDRLEELYREKEQLAQAGLSDAEEALSELEALREERDALKRERDQLAQELDTAQDEASSTEPDPSVLEAATVIRDQVGISSPEQARALTKVVDDLHRQVQTRAAAYGVERSPDADHVVAMLRSMANHLHALPDPEALPPDAADPLGAPTASDAQALADLATETGHRLAAHYDTTLDELAPDADDALSLLQALNEALDDRPAPSAAANGDAPPNNALPAEAGDILGIRSVEDARELEQLIDDMSAQLERLREEHKELIEAGLSVEDALTMIESMEAQLSDLYHHSEDAPDVPSGNGLPTLESLDAPLVHRVRDRIDLPDPPTDLSTVLQRLLNRIDTLIDERKPLAEADLTPEDAVALIDDMEAQLSALYQDEEEQHQENGEAARTLAAIEEVLGISSREEAEELSAIAHQMEDQLTSLYEEKKKLQDLGLSSIEDAVDMIESMEHQLDDLYDDKESLRDLQRGSTENQSTFQQLEALYAERQQLQQALGVSAAEDVIELVESLNSQLDDLYTGRDAELDPEERHDAQLWAPDSDDPDADDPDADDPDAPSKESPSDATDQDATDQDEADGVPDEIAALTVSSMERQLETLYREKETLLHHGFGSAEAAMDRLHTQQRQIDVLQRENHTYEQRLGRLKSELGTERVPEIVDLVRTLEDEADVTLDDLSPADSDEYSLHIEAAAPLVDRDTLDRLDEMPDDELATLDVGAMRLSSEGVVEALNEAALQLPGLPSTATPAEIRGKNFFLDLAPSTNNNLFYGRFQRGQSRGELDARFPYTFTSPNEDSASFEVHLYRPRSSSDTWLLFRPA